MFEDEATEICPYCGYNFAVLQQAHLDICKEIPPAEKLVEMLNSDAMITLTWLGTRYKTKHNFIVSRLKGTEWNYERLRQRGREVAVKKSAVSNTGKRKKGYKIVKGPRCGCGVLIEESEKKCSFCKADDEGLRTYHDMLDRLEEQWTKHGK
jgi:hypothetical protein